MIFFPDLFLYLIIDHRAPEPKQMPETNKVHKKDPETFCSKDFLAFLFDSIHPDTKSILKIHLIKSSLHLLL
jgi:hypothetical protein